MAHYGAKDFGRRWVEVPKSIYEPKPGETPERFLISYGDNEEANRARMQHTRRGDEGLDIVSYWMEYLFRKVHDWEGQTDLKGAQLPFTKENWKVWVREQKLDVMSWLANEIGNKEAFLEDYDTAGKN